MSTRNHFVHGASVSNAFKSSSSGSTASAGSYSVPSSVITSLFVRPRNLSDFREIVFSFIVTSTPTERNLSASWRKA